MQSHTVHKTKRRHLPQTPISTGELGRNDPRKRVDHQALNVPKMALPALNGSHHAEVDPSEPETERVWATLPRSLVLEIDDFHHTNRLRTRSVAVTELIRLGLQSDWRKKANA